MMDIGVLSSMHGVVSLFYHRLISITCLFQFLILVAVYSICQDLAHEVERFIIRRETFFN